MKKKITSSLSRNRGFLGLAGLFLLVISSSVYSTPSGYYAPFEEGTSARVSQGNDGTASHYGAGDAYAVDFAGQFAVYAPKDGTVDAIGTNSYIPPYCVTHPTAWHGAANYVRVRHDDGLYSYYFHLASIDVQQGDKVYKGKTIIGTSGNTGCSTNTHLHFQLSNAANMSRASSVRVYFDDIGDPTEGNTYVSQNKASNQCSVAGLPVATTTSDMTSYSNYGIITNLDANFIESRGTFAAILVGAIEKRFHRKLRALPENESSFTDIATAEKKEAVLKLASLYREGFNDVHVLSNVHSSGSIFRPNDSISRYEALALTVRLYEYFSRKEILLSSTSVAAFLDMEGFADTLRKGFESGLTAGYTTSTGRYFKPNNCVPRHEAVSFVEKLIKKLDEFQRIKVFLEMDAMTGVTFNGSNQWPSFSATAPGSTTPRSLQSIYSEVGIDLTVDQAATRFNDPRSVLSFRRGEPFNDNELHQLLTQNVGVDPAVSVPASMWHIRTFFVPQYQTSGVLGIMYEAPQQVGGAGEGRDGLAMFMNTIGNDNLRLLRTMAHELGHAFNLLHEDGDDGVPYDGIANGTTIMNQTRALTSNWVYEWNYKSLNHFYSHPLVRLQTNSTYEFGECHGANGSLLPVQP